MGRWWVGSGVKIRQGRSAKLDRFHSRATKNELKPIQWKKLRNNVMMMPSSENDL